jgi:hypothetical protein
MNPAQWCFTSSCFIGEKDANKTRCTRQTVKDTGNGFLTDWKLQKQEENTCVYQVQETSSHSVPDICQNEPEMQRDANEKTSTAREQEDVRQNCSPKASRTKITIQELLN